MLTLMRLLQHATKGEMCYAALKEAIVTGELAPGAPLVIQHVARELGVSEIPVREAVRRLQVEGLVAVSPYAGATVAPVRRRDLRETLEARAALEALAARLALAEVGPADLDELEACIAAMDGCASAGDMTEFSRQNRRFHQGLYRRCPNRRLLELCTSLMEASDRARAVFQRNPSLAPRSNAEHRRILQAVRARDPDRVEALVRAHQWRVAEAFAGEAGPEEEG
jgi:DNA-binding GntR family transcriptional regulator